MLKRRNNAPSDDCLAPCVWSAYCGNTIRIGLLLGMIAFTGGCDAVSITEITVGPGSPVLEPPSDFADKLVRVCRDTAARFELSEIKSEGQDARIVFRDSAGQNPVLWLTLEYRTVPGTIEIAEMYIARPTDKHSQLVASLLDAFASAGLTASISFETEDVRGWLWLLVAAMLMPGMVAWRSIRRCLRARQSATGP